MADSIYDPKKLIIDFAGLSASGFAPGTFCKVMRNEDQTKLQVGSDGEGVITRNQNKSGRCMITLQQDSLYNDYLTAKAALFEAGGGGIGPLLVKDLHGNTLCHAEKAWIVKQSDIEYSNEATNREWTIECLALEIFVGGAV